MQNSVMKRTGTSLDYFKRLILGSRVSNVLSLSTCDIACLI